MRSHFSLLTAVCALAVAASANAQQDPRTTAHSAAEEGASLDPGEYWTREMRENAEPLIWNEEPTPDSDLAPDYEDSGPSSSVDGRAPSSRANRRAQRDFLSEWEVDENPNAGESDNFSVPEDHGAGGADDDLEDFSRAAPEAFDAYPLGDPFYPARYPWTTLGRLFFNTGSSCTASVISQNNIVVTAAHCCYDRDARRFNTNFAFVPATLNDSAPFGVFPYQRARVLNAWINSGGRRNDVCVIRLRRNAVDVPVTSYTGWLGRSWNFSPLQHHHAFGYPGNLDQGKVPQVCASESFSLSNCGGSAVLHTGCDQTFGASGGPWIREYKPEQAGGVNFVNSVVSGHDRCSGTFGRVYNGARFTSSNIVPLCNDEGC